MKLAQQSQFLPDEGMSVLAQRICKGDPAAEDELVQLFSKRVFAMVLARTRDREAARDLTQDVLIAVLQALRNGQMRQEDKLAAFVYGTARNLVNNYFRSCTHQPRVETISSDIQLAQPAEDPDTYERVDLVRRALDQLDSIDRKILLMTLVDGLKPGEIAFQLSLSSDVVRQRKTRAVKKVVDRIKTMSQKGVLRPLLMWTGL